MSLIDYLNELIDYSMGFPFYQRLNPLFSGISNEDAPLSSGRSILARAQPLIKGETHWIVNQFIEIIN